MEIKALSVTDRNGTPLNFRRLVRKDGNRYWAEMEDPDGNTVKVSAASLMAALEMKIFGSDF